MPYLSELSWPLCLCVIDTRRHGEAACSISAAVSFMQLHHHRQDTSNHAHRCHRCVCECVSPNGSSAWRHSETQQRVEGHPTSITMDMISRGEAQVYCRVCRSGLRGERGSSCVYVKALIPFVLRIKLNPHRHGARKHPSRTTLAKTEDDFILERNKVHKVKVVG